ncbi:biotin/lipoyl-containing protein [Flexivirga sp. B27]
MARSLHAVPRALAVARVRGAVDATVPGGVTAPFGGVVTFCVAEGDRVRAGDVLATIEAMKLEAALTAPSDGRIRRLAAADLASVEGGDLLLEVEPEVDPETDVEIDVRCAAGKSPAAGHGTSEPPLGS